MQQSFLLIFISSNSCSCFVSCCFNVSTDCFSNPSWLFNEAIVINFVCNVLFTTLTSFSNDEIVLFNSIVERYADEINIKAYEATLDVGFNNHGCRNLLMLESTTHWNMLMDIDVYMEPTMVTAMVRNPLKEENIYVFKVAFDHPDDPNDYDHVDPKKILKFISHPNTWLITKPAFWSGGGYDIEFTGMRHGDAEFFLSLDRDKYDHVVFHPEDKVKHEIHVRNPNRNRSYLNQATEHVKNLGRTVDFVKKRNEDKIQLIEEN